MKVLICSQNGIGDGLIALIAAENLRREGHSVTMYHKCLGELGQWLPGHTIVPYPKTIDLSGYDKCYFFYTKDLDVPLDDPRVSVIYPYPGGGGDIPLIWKRPFAENLAEAFGSRETGLVVPEGIVKKPRQVAIHAVSSTERKDWPMEKFAAVAEGLRARGYDPLFLGGAEMGLDAVARQVAESRYLIGVDSGFGHLASALGIPTVTIARKKSTICFWRPGWAPGRVVTPKSWVPNLRGARLRDRYWKSLVSPRSVLAAFDSLSDRQPL